MKWLIPENPLPITHSPDSSSLLDLNEHESSQILAPLPSCPALVLAGGLGTRLRPIYRRGPKCLAPVGGRYFLEYILFWLRAAEIKDLVLCVGYKAAQIQNWLGDGSQQGFRVRYSVEEDLLGTAGALRLAARMVSTQTCVVLNGDSFLELDLREMWKFHRSKRSMATLALAGVQDSNRYGSVEIDLNGRIVAFHGKSDARATHPPDRRGSHLINGGVYLLQREILDSIPPGVAVSLEKEIFPGWQAGTCMGSSHAASSLILAFRRIT